MAQTVDARCGYSSAQYTACAMSDSLTSFLSQLHALLSSDALHRGVDAVNTVVDLASFCKENVSETEQGKVAN